MVCIFIILSSLGRIQSFFNIAVGLACLSQLLEAVFRWRPCTRRVGSGYKVRYYSGAVFIIWVLMVPQLVLTVTRAVVYTYSIQLSSGCWAGWLGFKGYLGWRQILSGSGVIWTFFFSFSKAGQPVVLVLSTRVVQSFTILLLYSCMGFFLLGTFFTVKALYVVLGIRLSSTEYLYRASLLLLAIPHGRQFLK